MCIETQLPVGCEGPDRCAYMIYDRLNRDRTSGEWTGSYEDRYWRPDGRHHPMVDLMHPVWDMVRSEFAASIGLDERCTCGTDIDRHSIDCNELLIDEASDFGMSGQDERAHVAWHQILPADFVNPFTVT